MTTLTTDRPHWATPTDRNRAELVALLTERTMAVVDPKHYTTMPTLTQAWYQAHAARWGLDAYLDTLDAATVVLRADARTIDDGYESHLAHNHVYI